MECPRLVRGDLLGVEFPTSIEALLAEGPRFLTAAFRAAGALEPDNEVTAITEATEVFTGGMGRKLLLSVAYARPAPVLHQDLFVKFPRDFGDPLRDLFGPLMAPEVRFALLSRRDGFPIQVPKCYFADYHAASVSGLLITERIAYGRNGIEPCPTKAADYEIADPLPHYRAMTRSMARLAAHHRAGLFGPEIDREFPFDPEAADAGARIPYTAEQLDEKLAKLQAFAQRFPQLFSDGLGDPEFLDRFVADAPLVLEAESAIRAFLQHQPECIALCHWNMNIDNAWFWTDAAGELRTGLLDWGSVGQMNLAQAFFGMTCAAETGFLDAHRDDLIRLLAEEYRQGGGPELDPGKLAYMIKLATALLGIAWILDAPSLVEQMIPDLDTIRDRFDPRIKENFLARCQLQLLMVFLNEWRAGDIGAAVRALGPS
jgi:hypothetical protein